MAETTKSDKLILYHGSKAGIEGSIAPISRARCDFGAGFYMGTERQQPLTLICTNEKPVLYTVELDRFFDGLITDRALVESLSALSLGKQYVAITEKACDNIKIVDEETISEQDLVELRIISEENRAEGIRIADEIIRQNRRGGRYFDEIIGEGL